MSLHKANSLKLLQLLLLPLLLLLPECLPGTRDQNGSVASAGAGAGAGAGVLLRAGACPGARVGLVARLVRLLVASALAVHTAARL